MRICVLLSAGMEMYESEANFAKIMVPDASLYRHSLSILVKISFHDFPPKGMLNEEELGYLLTGPKSDLATGGPPKPAEWVS